MATKTAKKTTIKPLDDRVLVKPDEPEERTESGIILPDSAQEKPLTGEVVAVGPGKLNDSGERTPVSVQPGDRVFYGRFGGTQVELNDEEHVILRDSELLAKVE
jgi:chaperonin GroES